MEEYCAENNVELHFRQISKSEAHLKAFNYVFNSDEEKVELPDFWPENVTVSRFDLNEAARDWLISLDQNWVLASPQFNRRKKQRSTELSVGLHNVRSVRNKTKDSNALLEVNEISFWVFIESWITNNSDDDFILKRCYHPGFLFYSAPRVNKRGGGICVFYRCDLHLENFEKFVSECCYASLSVGATTYLVIAVYWPPGLNVKSFIDHFTVLFEEKG